MQEKINYKDVIALGFERDEQSDDIFFNQYGFPYSIVSMKLAKNIISSWDCVDRTVKIDRLSKEQDILGTILCKNLSEVKEYLKFYGKYEETEKKMSAWPVNVA
jgi:hypothetical protein